ncbi:MAG: tyrosyl-tRNA synthetase [Limisphaerales bacterium]|nr:MAG: tyrosyl-tRNA synthetase [Limisphaerales bacterium]KAG0510279.1 MAG: tyrosyl-tRNA synthetase [Limisphaerales bacterium]TXT51838.1 MAG: tyrosyl-tRNA synthetase [Limisphaerales bacterium]
MNIYEELQWRGLVSDCTDAAELQRQLAVRPVTLYCGFDPTADSLHVGSLVPLLALRRFQNAGHCPIAVAGGATGSIGDPSGKTAERQLLTKDQINANVEAVRPQLARLLDFNVEPNRAFLVDNAEWTAGVSFLDFLRDIGKHFSVNMMMAKESVRARMEDREVGISYTEFSYMLLQAFDFYVLARDHNCDLQIGGSDQWGNITAGTDLIRKKLARPAWGLTLPLITKADGTKFGKTEAGTIWLDANRTSIYEFYQFWIRTDDQDVGRYLKYFTFLGKEEIEEIELRHSLKPEKRYAQERLAMAVCEIVHPAEGSLTSTTTPSMDAQIASQILFGGALEGVSESAFDDVIDQVPLYAVDPTRLAGVGLPLVEGLVLAHLCPSKGQARRDLEGGGIYVNNVRETNPQRALTTADLLFGKHLLLRKGKKNYTVLTVK